MKLRSLLVASAAAMLSLAVTSPVLAQAGSAKVRIAHFSPDAPAVDVYIDGQKRLTNVQYDKHSAYLDTPAKAKTKVEIRPTGSAATSTPVISAEPDLEAGKNYTIAAIGKLANLQGKVYVDDVTAPPAGRVKLRIIHGAPDIKPVDIVVKGGQKLATQLAFPDATEYLTLPPGTYSVEVLEAGTTTALLSNEVILLAGGVYTVAAIGGGDKQPKLKGLIDLAATAGAPADSGVTTLAPDATTATGAPTETETSVASVDTTPETTVADTTIAPDTTAVDTTVAETSDTVVDTSVADTTVADTTVPDTTVPEEPTTTQPDNPVSGVDGGFGGLSGGGAVGATALLGAAAAVMAVAARRRATR